MTVHKNKLNFGFTLIELLIVIAILGVLAVVVLVAINPVQQLARTRDAGRESSVTQIGHALEAYAVSHDGTYPDADVEVGAGWADDLVLSSEITTIPSGVASSNTARPACETLAYNTTWCYGLDANGKAIVYARLESDAKNSLCTDPSNPDAYFVYSTANGRGGIVCADSATAEPAAGTQSFIN